MGADRSGQQSSGHDDLDFPRQDQPDVVEPAARLRPGAAAVRTHAAAHPRRQGSLDQSGALLHEGDVTAQLALAMANVETLLVAGGMDLRDVIALTIYTTDVDAALAGYGAITERLALVGATPPATLVGVTRLAIPGMAVEITVQAGR
jgi:enamine deaminase RidA (YjgF/YER057c/UK114 family)